MIWYLISNENLYLSINGIKIGRLITLRWQNPLYVSLLKNGSTLVFQDQSQKQLGKEMLWPSAMNIWWRKKGQKAIGVLFLTEM